MAAIDDSLRLALQLQQAELEGLEKGAKGKGLQGEPDSVGAAIEAFRAELAQQVQIIEDHDLGQQLSARSGAAAPRAVARPKASTTARQASAIPRTVAGPSRLPAESTVHQSPTPQAKSDTELGGPKKELTSQDIAADGDEGLPQIPLFRCIACGDSHDENSVAKAKCRHTYCADCIVGLFTAAMTDESLFPPRCCKKPIPLEDIINYVDNEFATEFRKKEVEFTTINRVYCSLPTCSKFIPPSDINSDLGHCRGCGSETCAICKNAGHNGPCPEDSSKKEVLDLAKTEGWQQCSQCQRLVELDRGCHHISTYCTSIP